MAQLKIKQVLNLQTELDAKAVDTAVMKKASNLSDVSNVTTSRSNLSVYSIAEVDALIAGTGNAKSVAIIAARNALTNLNISDRVFVTNDGDGNWAIYIVTAIDHRTMERTRRGKKSRIRFNEQRVVRGGGQNGV